MINYEWSGEVTKCCFKVLKRFRRAPKWSGRVLKWSCRVTNWSGRVPKWSGRVPKKSGRVPKWSGRVLKWNGRVPNWSAKCPYNWGVGSAFHLMKIHIWLCDTQPCIFFQYRCFQPEIISHRRSGEPYHCLCNCLVVSKQPCLLNHSTVLFIL